MTLSSRRLLSLTGLLSLWATTGAPGAATAAAYQHYDPRSSSFGPLNPFVLAKRTSPNVPWSPKSKPRAHYNLGLGKNLPVIQSKVSSSSSGSNDPRSSSSRAQEKHGKTRAISSNNVAAATRFWVDHQAVNQLPSPMQKPPSSKKKVHLVPHRLAGDDVLKIHMEQQAVAVAQTRNVDLNTAWVEMLIHEQQSKRGAVKP